MVSPWRPLITGSRSTSSLRPRRSTRRRATGAGIPIEERDGAEITARFEAHNPAFDVTPAELIAAIVTEDGVHRPPYEGVAAAMSVLDELVREVAADPDSIGLILHGSRAAGVDGPDSDFDLIRVVTDESYAARRDREELRERRPGPPKADISYASPERLRLHADATDGYTPMFVNAKVIADTDGRVAALVEAIVVNAGARAWDELDDLYDDYLNCFFRSLKAWRRGDELGGRMQAAHSCLRLVRLLFAAERRLPPYHDQLRGPLETLERAQGWEEGFLPTR